MLRSIARPLMARVKETTGILGLDVEPNARKILIDLYKRILKRVEEEPDKSGWWIKEVKYQTQKYLLVCEKSRSLNMIEDRIRRGQVEELIENANRVLEKLTADKVDIVEDIQPVPKRVLHVLDIIYMGRDQGDI